MRGGTLSGGALKPPLKKIPELLSPAGNLERLRFALAYGADAVYVGLPSFSLRSRGEGFDLESLKAAIELTHRAKKKIYIAANSFLKESELEDFKNLIFEVSQFKPDAFIVSDLGALKTVKEITDIDIHISTQANTLNSEAALLLKELGASRVVLARELSLKEIKKLKERIKDSIELELFVHGALCMAYSGRCFLSLYLTGRDANKGECAQVCRWRFRPEGTQEELLLEEFKDGTYILNSKDLCALPILDKLFSLADSLKIEGRTKSFHYVAVTTAVYKKALELLSKSVYDFKAELPALMGLLESTSHRPFTGGFYAEEKDLQYPLSSGYIRKADVLAYFESGIWKVRGKVLLGQNVELVTPSLERKTLKIAGINDGVKSLDQANPNKLVELTFENLEQRDIPDLSILRKFS